MTPTTKNILIIAGIAVAGYFAWQYYQAKKAKTVISPAPGTSSNSGSSSSGTSGNTGNTVAEATDLWNQVSNLFS